MTARTDVAEFVTAVRSALDALEASVAVKPEPKKAAPKKAPKAAKAEVTLKPLSRGEIKRLRAQRADWVSGKADWQLQGRKPANAVAKGRIVPESVLAAHGYKRPTGALRDAIKAANA